MKEYRYKINGNLYKVTVGDIEENQVQVEVNGTPYKVELEKKATPKIKPVMRTASTTPAAPPPAVSRPAAPSSKGSIKSPLPGVILDVKVKEGEARTDPDDPGSHEDGKRHQIRPRRKGYLYQGKQGRIDS